MYCVYKKYSMLCMFLTCVCQCIHVKYSFALQVLGEGRFAIEMYTIYFKTLSILQDSCVLLRFIKHKMSN